MYKNNNHVTPIYTYQNSTTSDLSSIPVIYVEPGDVYYFVYNKYNYVKPNGPRTPTYTASVINAAVADVPENQFDSAGYVDDQEVFGYNNNTVKVYSESSCNAIHDSSNTYLQLIEDAMSEWNKVGCLQFVSTNSRSEANIFVKCTFDGENGTTGSYFHYNRTPKTGGELSINRSYCDGYSYSYVLDTIIHEFGHSIGFGHINYAYGANVMYYRTSDYVSFGQGDLAVYHYKWGLLQ
ncbi:MAG: M57 family metalloprotease [Bacilli bacterium]|nr:M57 family metalloprotease [Bacilli bacterium]